MHVVDSVWKGVIQPRSNYLIRPHVVQAVQRTWSQVLPPALHFAYRLRARETSTCISIRWNASEASQLANHDQLKLPLEVDTACGQRLVASVTCPEQEAQYSNKFGVVCCRVRIIDLAAVDDVSVTWEASSMRQPISAQH